MANKLEVWLPSDTEVRVTRNFNAPRAMVWQAHTDPNLLRRWMHGYAGWSLPVCEMDVRVGGKYRWRWRSDDGAQQFGFFGTFSEVDAPATLAYDQHFDAGDAGFEMPTENPTLIRATYTEKNGVTTLVTVMDFGSKEARDAAVATGMTDGMETSYERLESMLTG